MNFRYKNFRFDNALILTTIAKIAYENSFELTDDEELVLHAIKRANFEFNNLSIAEIGKDLSEFNENQLLGFSNNVKGILHELQFIEIENEDDDNFTASIFTETNNEGFDVLLTNEDTGEIIELQLKATNDSSYINDWIENYSENEILVTEEIAEKMNLKSSEISNEDITVETDEFINKVIESSDNDEFWEYVPYLSSVSIAIAGFNLFKRYKNSQIDFKTFKNKFIKLTGIKFAKFAIVSVLLMVPIVNVLTGATLLYLTLEPIGNSILKKGT